MERYQNNVQDTAGNAVGSVTVTVRRVSDGALATLFSDNSGTSKGNPFTNDLDGEFFFYAADNRYNIFFTGPITDQKDDVLLLDVLTTGNTIRINTDINTATPPVAEAVVGTYEIFDLANDAKLAQLGFAASNILELKNFMHGGDVRIIGQNASGGNRTLLSADPDTTVDLYNPNDNVLRLRMLSSGRVELQSNANTDAENRLLLFSYQDGTDKARIGHAGDGVFNIRNIINGSGVLIEASDAGGTQRTILSADPDGETILRADTTLKLQTTAGEAAITCTTNAGVALYYNNQSQFRTSLESANDIGMGAEVRHSDDNFYPVGMNVLPEDAGLDSGNVSLLNVRVGMMLTYNTATARSLQLNDAGSVKVGAMWALLVGPSAGTLTGDGGAGVQIRWWNGSGWTTTAAAGNITIGVGQYTIWKETDTLYWISGPTLS